MGVRRGWRAVDGEASATSGVQEWNGSLVQFSRENAWALRREGSLKN